MLQLGFDYYLRGSNTCINPFVHVVVQLYIWCVALHHYIWCLYCTISLGNVWTPYSSNNVFANGLGDLGSIPGRVIPKTQKMVLDASLLNTQHYKVRIKGKVKQSREGVAPSPTPWCSSYRKGSLRVILDYGRQLNYYCSSRLALALNNPCELICH